MILRSRGRGTSGGAWLALVAALLVLGCQWAPLDRRSLYEQLGGESGLERLVDRFLRELAADQAVAARFRKVDIRRFRTNLTEHLCEISDGPCRYSGDSMREVHRNMEITQGDFNAVVEDLIRAMESLRIRTATQNRLLARLAPMQPDITETRAERRRPGSGPVD